MMIVKWFVCISLIFVSTHAFAFKLQPLGTKFDQDLAQLNSAETERLLASLTSRGVGWFTSSVHEEATHRAFGCDAPLDSRSCARGSSAPPALINGVRWNDNPPFRVSSGFVLPNGKTIDNSCADETIKLPRKSNCWVTIFSASDEYSKKRFFSTRNGVMLNRSHFGDMQFLHAMASRVGDRAEVTKGSIMMWAQFSYEVALGEIPANTPLKDIKIDGFSRYFPNAEATVENFFLMGDSTFRGEQLKSFVLGTLIHMVQDSFSKAHVERSLVTQGKACPGLPGIAAPAAVNKFLVYGAQDAKDHGRLDDERAFEAHLREFNPNVVDVGRVIKQFFDRRAPWSEFSKYVDCVFALLDQDAEADGGAIEAK